MMLNDWIQTNLDQRITNKRINFKVGLNPYKMTKPWSFYGAALFTANLLANTNDRIFIAYSGGLDSQFVVNMFHENKIPFTPILVKTTGNEQELQYAFDHCKYLNVEPTVLTLSNEEHISLWYNMVFKTHGLKGMYTSPSLKAALFADEQGGVLVEGCGEPISSVYTNFEPTLYVNEFDFAVNIAEGLTKKHPGSFFMYTQELFYSYMIEVNRNLEFQQAKATLYQLKTRDKIRPRYDRVFEAKLKQIEKLSEAGCTYRINQQEWLEILENHCVI